MKKILISLVLILLVFSAFGAEQAPSGIDRAQKNVYYVANTDTVEIPTGDTYKIYADSSDSSYINMGKFQGDSIVYSAMGYGDADATSASIQVFVSTNGVAFAAIATDTITTVDNASNVIKQVAFPNMGKGQFYIQYTSYGTTDTTRIVSGTLEGK